MKKEVKIGLLLLGIVIGIITNILLLINSQFDYLIITVVATFVLILSLFIFIHNNSTPEEMFKSTLNRILKTYDGILINCKNIPKLEGKNIILVDTIQDLIDAQAEIRKPVYYKRTISSCSFIILDTNEVCIYTLKTNNDILSPLEIELEEIKKKERKKAENYDESILNEIEKTTIVKLENNKIYKISPIHSKNQTEMECI